jgi:fibronectin-binding autotransporter adhesin
VSLRSGASLKGRIGLALDYKSEWQDEAGRKAAATVYGVANLNYEFLDGTSVAVSGTDLSFAGQKFNTELGIGGTLDWADSAHALHGELLGSTSFQGSYAVKGTLGFTSRF